MTEAAKTTSLIFVALAVLAIGFLTRPQPPKPPTEDLVGKTLFDKLDDPLKIKKMRILTYDEGAGKVRQFEVAQVDGVTSLPSHKGYPADAKDQVAAANTALVDLKVLGVASKNPEDHALYGVVEPDPAKDQTGAGVGKLVVVEGDSNKPLAQLIIGKEDKPKAGDEFGGSQSKFRYVRVPGQDVVYRAALAADKFSPKFENWIETDLLKLNPYDIRQIDLHDYTASVGVSAGGRLAVQLDKHADIDLAFNDQDSKWTLEKLVTYDNGKPTTETLPEGDELNSAKLNEMKTALHDLKIVDVARKPAQMSANLKSQSDFTQDDEAFQSLASKGFLPVPLNGEIEILSDSGEAIVDMKDGVQYVLRFGKISGIDSGSEEKEENADEKDSKKGDDDTLKLTEKKGASVNRYVMVMARFNPDLLPKPDLEPVPEIKTAPETPDAKSPDDKQPDAGKADAAKKGEEKSAKAKTDEAKSESAKSSEEDAKDENPSEDLEAQEARRDKIEKENKRKQDEYDEQVKKAEEKVKELNGRFADWYYVISDATYRKIHLGIDDIIKKKTQAGQEGQAGAAVPMDPFLGKGPEKPAEPGADKGTEKSTEKESEKSAEKDAAKATEKIAVPADSKSAGKAAPKASGKAPAAAAKK